MTVFLSYGHQDGPVATQLARDLEDLEGGVWLDKSLTGGQHWWDEILRQIRDCRLFVLAVSRHSLNSSACLAEASYALAVGRPLLAVRIGKVDLLGAPPEIRSIQVIDYVPGDAQSIKDLARAVLHAPLPGPVPATLPPAPPLPESYRDRFAALFGQSLPMPEQVSALARLKLDIDNDQNADDARELLVVLRDRPDVAWRVREDIVTLLAQPARVSAPEPADTGGPAPAPAEARPAPAPAPLPQAGWYTDPTGRFEVRYWDGGEWTAHVSRRGQRATDPVTGGA